MGLAMGWLQKMRCVILYKILIIIYFGGIGRTCEKSVIFAVGKCSK